MILVVSRDQLLYIMITWSTAVDHEKYTAPCYRFEYANSDRINFGIKERFTIQNAYIMQIICRQIIADLENRKNLS